MPVSKGLSLLATLPHLGPPEVWALLRNARNEIMPGAAISGSFPLQILPMGASSQPAASQQPLPEGPVYTSFHYQPSPQSSTPKALVPSGPAASRPRQAYLTGSYSGCGGQL